MSERTEQESVDLPETVFSALGDETRLRILLELAAVANERGVGAGVSFSELRQRVGVEDSGRFNYHLDKLSGSFITKREGQYIPLGPTMEVASAVHAGTYSSEPGEHSTESDWHCPECDDRLLLQYTGELLFLWCERDDGYLLAYGMPPGAFEGRSLEELAAVTYRRATMEINTARQGICPRCWGHTRVSYPVDPEAPPQLHAAGDAVQTRLVCDRCWLRYNVPLRAVVASSPTVRSLLRRDGLDPVRAAITGQAGDTTLDWAVSVDEEDPVRASVRLELGTDGVAVDLDEDARIIDRRHSGQA
jgi:DNA-binding transcriptional ArsR family regulator